MFLSVYIKLLEVVDTLSFKLFRTASKIFIYVLFRIILRPRNFPHFLFSTIGNTILKLFIHQPPFQNGIFLWLKVSFMICTMYIPCNFLFDIPPLNWRKKVIFLLDFVIMGKILSFSGSECLPVLKYLKKKYTHNGIFTFIFHFDLVLY